MFLVWHTNRSTIWSRLTPVIKVFALIGRFNGRPIKISLNHAVGMPVPGFFSVRSSLCKTVPTLGFFRATMLKILSSFPNSVSYSSLVFKTLPTKLLPSNLWYRSASCGVPQAGYFSTANLVSFLSRKPSDDINEFSNRSPSPP